MQVRNETNNWGKDASRVRNTFPQCDKKTLIRLAKLFAITVALVFLAFLSVSDGDLTPPANAPSFSATQH
jgi:hypothetical protein